MRRERIQRHLWKHGSNPKRIQTPIKNSGVQLFVDDNRNPTTCQKFAATTKPAKNDNRKSLPPSCSEWYSSTRGRSSQAARNRKVEDSQTCETP